MDAAQASHPEHAASESSQLQRALRLVQFSRWLVLGFLVVVALRLFWAPQTTAASVVPLRGMPVLLLSVLICLPWQLWLHRLSHARDWLWAVCMAYAVLNLQGVYFSGFRPWDSVVLLLSTFVPALLSLNLAPAAKQAPWQLKPAQLWALAGYVLFWCAMWTVTLTGPGAVVQEAAWMWRVNWSMLVIGLCWYLLLYAHPAGQSVLRFHLALVILGVSALSVTISNVLSVYIQAHALHGDQRPISFGAFVVALACLLVVWRLRHKPAAATWALVIGLLWLHGAVWAVPAVAPLNLPVIALLWLLVWPGRQSHWSTLAWLGSVAWYALVPQTEPRVVMVHALNGSVVWVLSYLVLRADLVRQVAPPDAEVRAQTLLDRADQLRLLGLSLAVGLLTLGVGYGVLDVVNTQTLQAMALLAVLLAGFTYASARHWLERANFVREHQSLGQVSAVLSATTVGYCLYRRDGSAQWANAHVLEQTGWSEQAFRASHVLQDPVWIQSGVADAAQAVLAGADPIKLLYSGPGALGGLWDVRITVSQVLLDGLEQVLLQIDDMRSVHLQQEALEEANQALKTAVQQLDMGLESAQLGAFSVDLQAQAIFADQRSLEMWGIAPDDRTVPMAAAKFRARVYAPDWPRVKAQLAQANDLECRMLGYDGTTRQVLIQRQLIHDARGRAWQHGITRDVTTLREQESQLQSAHDRMALQTQDLREKQRQLQELTLHNQAERRKAESLRRELSTLVQAQDNAVAMVDLEGRVQLCNRAFARLLGKRLEQVQGQLLADVDLPEIVQVVAPLQDAVLQGQTVHAEVELSARAGQAEQHLKLSLTPRYDEQAQVVGVIQSSTDITALVQARNQAQAGARAKHDFVNTISHELRTPLNGMLGTLQLLDGLVQGEQARQYLSTCQYSAHLLLSLVNDVLDFGKLDAGALELDPQPGRIDQMLERLQPLMQAIAREPAVALQVALDPSLDQTLVFDDFRLGQVLLNLVSNAIKFTHAGHVQVQAQVLGQAGARVRVRLSVSDTGIGMSSETLARLFTPFTQADSSHSRRYGGTGLGLTISMRLVQAMGSRIEVSSVEGQGSTFQFTLDLARPESLRDPGVQAQLPSLALQGRRLLVVDDVAMNRQVLVDMLQACGAQAVQAINGHMALQVLEQSRQRDQTPIDLVLMDVQMPVMDGLEATRRLRAHDDPALAQLPVVLVTGNASSSVVDLATQLGIRQVMSKPVGLVAVLQVVQGELGAPALATAPQPTPAQVQAPEQVPAQAALATAASSGTEYRALAGVRVLVVDDQKVNRLVAGKLLEHLGATVVEAAGGAQAIDLLEAQNLQVDVVLMDMRMPGVDGLEATRRLRASANNHVRSLPVVALSGDTDQASRRQAQAAGMNGFLHKPVQMQELSNLTQLLANSAPSNQTEVS